MTELQATVATFSTGTNSGTVLSDTGAEISFDGRAFAHSGMRFLRLGQRVALRIIDGHVVAIRHASFPFP